MARTSHHAKAKVNRRRAHLHRKPIQVSVCANCGGATLAHKSCPQCGTYKKHAKKAPKAEK